MAKANQTPAKENGTAVHTDELLNIHKEIQKNQERTNTLLERFNEIRDQRLENLHVELGFEDRDELIESLIAKGSRNFKRVKAGGNGGGRGKRLSEDTKKQIVADLKKAAESGDTSKDIAERYGVSVPTVQNIKKKENLVKTR